MSSATGTRTALGLLGVLLTVAGSEAAEHGTHGGCSSWAIVWHTQSWREAEYLEHQLFQGWNITESIQRYTAPRREGRSASRKVERTPEPGEVLDGEMGRRGDAGDGLRDCSIAVTRIRQVPGCDKSIAIAKAYKEQGLTALFVVVGEENHNSCSNCREFYGMAGGLVLRHYQDPVCARRFQNVMFIPMGVSEGIGGVAIGDATLGKPASTRRYGWSFASSHRNAARDQIASFARRSRPAKEMVRLLIYPGKDPDYIATLADSAFVLTPRGNHEDTWRLYEAIACGAIPVVTDRAYWARMLPADVVAAFIVMSCKFTLSTTGRWRDSTTDCSAESFETAFATMSRLVASPARLDARQMGMEAAWAKYDAGWRKELADRAIELRPHPVHQDDL